MAEFEDGYWWSNDGLRLHYRDYPGRADRPPILCIPGLTRNARDYEGVAARLSGDGWRVIVVELRGRGESGYAKDPMSYAPLSYVQDIEALIAELKLGGFVAFGTSLGGIVTMLLASTAHEKLAAALLNDVGPVIAPAGLERIRTYVGRSSSWPTWLHAARALGEANRSVYPDYALDDWLRMAKQLYRVTAGGRIALDYDMKIAEPFRLPGGEAGFDLWPALDALADTPALIVRGGLSDVLAEDTVEAMLKRLPKAQAVTVPRVGHAPTLEEPEAAKAIDDLLKRVG